MKKRAKAPDVGAEQRKYRFVAGSRLPKGADPQVVGELLEQLRQERNGYLGAEDVVHEASDPASPLHAAFPESAWDDAAAAHAHRLELARHLIRSVTITIITPKQKPVEARMFVEAAKTGPRGTPYTSIDDALENPEMRAQLLKDALREALVWRRRWSELSELAQLFEVVDGFANKTGARVA